MAEIVQPVRGDDYLELNDDDIRNVIDALRIAEVATYTITQGEHVKKKVRNGGLTLSAQFGALAEELEDWEARD